MRESNRIEFKGEMNDKLEKEIVAFLNNQEGGILYIGLDNDGHPTGIVDLDTTQLKMRIVLKTIFYPLRWGYLIL